MNRTMPTPPVARLAVRGLVIPPRLNSDGLVVAVLDIYHISRVENDWLTHRVVKDGIRPSNLLKELNRHP